MNDHYCSGCTHWHAHRIVHKDGYLVAACTQPKDDRDHVFRRGGERCQHWERQLKNQNNEIGWSGLC